MYPKKEFMVMSRWQLVLLCSLMSVLSVNAQKIPQDDHKTVSAKFGDGINFTARDSSFSLKFGARFQTLFIAERPLSDGAKTEKELLTRRFRLKFDGFAFSPRLEYKIELALSNRDNAPVISQGADAANIVLDAVLKYGLSKNTEVWFGQTKLPGNRERVISSQTLQFVDRSLVNASYNLDRDLGLQLHHQFNLGNVVVKDKYAVALGQGRNITLSDTGGFSYTGRLEVLPFGEFSNKGDYFDADLEREPRPKLSLAAGYSYNDGAMRQAGELGSFLEESRDLKTFFADVMLKYRGWSLTSEYMNKQASGGAVLKDKSNYFLTGRGWNIQSGYLFKNNIEIAARYTIVDPSAEIKMEGLEDRIREYTLGVSKYFVGHNLKVQSDISHIRNYMDTDPALRYRLQVELAF
jgi:phosphate-selective porin OprO and OprP